MQVLKEPRSLPADPPFGSLVPPSCWDQTAGLVESRLQELGCRVRDDVYVDVAADELEGHRQSLGSAMKSWLSQAEDDLLFVLGSGQAKANRGAIPKTMLVNVINTFKAPVEGTMLSSKAIKWVQLRFLEVAKAVEAWSVSTTSTVGTDRHRGPLQMAGCSARKRVVALCRATMDHGIIKSLSRFISVCLRKQWHPPLKSVISQLIELIACTGCRKPHLEICKTISARARMFASTAFEQAQSLEKEELNSCSQSWKEFISKAGECSAAIAHKFTKVPLSVGPAVTNGNQLPRDVQLQQQVDLWSSYWKEDGPVPKPQCYSSVPKLPPLSVSQILKASKSFPRRTCSRSGLHPRHFALLPAAAISSLISIFEAAEAVGCMPPQLDSTVMALLPKPSGGTRTIGLYQSLFRVWAETRSGLVKHWEKDHASINGFSSGKNRSALDVVWRQAFAAEAARFAEQHYGCIIWDIHKCYESVQHSHLVRAAHSHQYPLAILRLSLASYTAPRRILFNGLPRGQLLPNAASLQVTPLQQQSSGSFCLT